MIVVQRQYYMAQYGKVNYGTEHVHDLSILGTTTLSHIHQSWSYL